MEDRVNNVEIFIVSAFTVLFLSILLIKNKSINSWVAFILVLFLMIVYINASVKMLIMSFFISERWGKQLELLINRHQMKILFVGKYMLIAGALFVVKSWLGYDYKVVAALLLLTIIGNWVWESLPSKLKGVKLK